MPAEWERHDATWLAWPHHDDWEGNLAPARAEVAELARIIGRSGERVRMLVADDACEASARAALGDVAVEMVRMPYGDIWLRDTGPIFLRSASGELRASCFGWNGWGNKYLYAHDDAVGRGIAELVGVARFDRPFVLEGGGIEVDGEGTCLTTRQCLLNPNRNGDMPQAEVERALAEGLGIETVLWLGDGLANDHTDGHIDTLARFVAPGVVLAMEPADGEDPNRDVLTAILSDLATMRDHTGRTLEIVTVTSPGRVTSPEGRLLPASYANYYLTNEAVIVPTYGADNDARAVETIGALFPTRRAIGSSARAILTGGGAFHCITQQQPAALL